MNNKRETGRILKGIGGFYYVACGNGVIECKAGGRLRRRDTVPLAGDIVAVELDGQERGFIVEILPRRNALIRPPIANLDQVFIVVSEAPPVTDPYLADKVTVIALQQGVRPVLVVNKTDLACSDFFERTYGRAGFTVLRTSANTGEGCNTLEKMMAGKLSCFTGNSGVGKSSLLRRITGADLSVGAISEKIGRGKNTTRHVELFQLKNGALVADTPGFSSFELSQMQRIRKDELQHLFPEMEPAFGQCRFTGCAHIKEPGCAVQKFVSEGLMAQSRYESYVKLYEELKKIKDWQ